jgi:hypothetical protein
VLTGPSTLAGSHVTPIRRSRPAVASGMVRVGLEHRPLTASVALVLSGELPRPLQQILFEAADSLTRPTSPQFADLVSLTTA